MHDDNRQQERKRYARQAMLPFIGDAGQRRLEQSRALIVGCGALGCAVAESLTRAGVGSLTLVDRDFVDRSNLQRQTLFSEEDADLKLPKAEAAKRRLLRINHSVNITAIVDDLSHRSAERHLAETLPEDHFTEVASPPRVIVDGTDNFETRYLLNDCAVRFGVPYIYAGVVGVTGMVMTILPRRPAQGASCTADRPWRRRQTPCLRCVFPDAPAPASTPTCETAGVLGPAVSIVAGFEAAEAIKVLLGRYDDVEPSLLTIDAWTQRTKRVNTGAAMKNGDCPCCAQGDFAYLRGEKASSASAMCGRDSVQLLPPQREGPPLAINLDQLADRLAAHGLFHATPFLLHGVFSDERSERDEPIELTVFTSGRAIIKGTSRQSLARDIYARHIGA